MTHKVSLRRLPSIKAPLTPSFSKKSKARAQGFAVTEHCIIRCQSSAPAPDTCQEVDYRYRTGKNAETLDTLPAIVCSSGGIRQLDQHIRSWNFPTMSRLCTCSAQELHKSNQCFNSPTMSLNSSIKPIWKWVDITNPALGCACLCPR